jgi:hypothetical protein
VVRLVERLRVAEAKPSCTCDAFCDGPCQVHGHAMREQDIRALVDSLRGELAEAKRASVAGDDLREWTRLLINDATGFAALGKDTEGARVLVNAWLRRAGPPPVDHELLRALVVAAADDTDARHAADMMRKGHPEAAARVAAASSHVIAAVLDAQKTAGQ